MYRKSCLLVSLMMLLSVAAVSSATDYIWDNDANDGNWNNAQNWSPETVPGTASGQYARIRMTTGPVFDGQTASVYRIYLETAGNGTLTMHSGSLTTGNHIYAAAVYTDIATINMSGGAINIGGTLYVARDNGSSATVELSGGTITCNLLNMGAGGRIDITSTGTLVINNDVTGTIGPWITGGRITAYGGAGEVAVDFNDTNPGKTTVTGLAPTKAVLPSPVDNATNVSTLTNLSWTGMLEATSHDVYLGTTSPGTFQGNTTELTFDPGALAPNTTYYWRIDEKVGEDVVSTGDVWSFRTGSNVATDPTPTDGATSVSVSSSLSWTPGVTATSHNVYFGTTNPPPSVGNQPEATYNPGTLAVDTTYYWRIDEVHDANVYPGTVWSFTTEPAVSKGPYLIYPGINTQMTVLWQLPLTQNCTLAWGTDTTYSTGNTATTEYGTDHQHRYTITGLTPGTKYYYKVTTPLIELAGSFRTAPATDAATVKFMVYGDTRTNADSHAVIASAVNSLYGSDSGYQTMMLLSGDWVNSDDEINWTEEYFNRNYSSALQMQANIPIIGCMGNHETMGAGTMVYDKYWPYPYVAPVSGRYWSFDYGPVHIVVVDQYFSYAPGSPQYTWLVNDLSTSTKKWKMILLHQPGWCAGGSHGNDASVQTYIQPLCEQYGVQVVFAGHNHYYSRAVVNGVQHVTTGAGGAPFYTATAGQPNVVTYTTNVLEFCKVNVYSDSFGVEVINASTGGVIDSFFVNTQEPDLTFVQLTDVQIGMCEGAADRWQTAVNKVNVVNPAFAIDTGDHVQNWSDLASRDTYLSIAANIKPSIPLYHIPGNHDVGDTPTADRYTQFLAVFPNGGSVPWYSFSYGNTLFICLESMVLKTPSGYPDANTAQMSWLTSELQRTGFTHKIVFMHISPCLVSVSEPDQTFNMPGPIRAELLSLFHQYGVDAVFSGHYHVPAYVNDNGLEIVTTESCTCPLGSLSTDTAGIQIVTIYPDHIEHSYRTLDSIIGLKGDFNDDGIVDFKDVGALSGSWLDTGIWP
jgi:predicted phosphodiesterase